MSTSVDNRVVEMQFNNKHFENNVSTSLSTLEKLKQALHLNGATKGLEEVNAAAKKVDMSGLSNSVETVRLKFSALQVMAVTALTNITNAALNAGKRIVSALTIDPIKTGFSEYETQINAIQTILANTQSKGTTLNDVNSALDTLNTYADKTIYNFTEMTRNIGTFTAAGIDLETSVNSIQGIANLAAISGSTSQQASTAMYQLSQALASGTVKLMDWNSVVNAGMGGQVFQDALKETARAYGVNIDGMIEANGSFRETLQEGWLTADILNDTLQKFTLTTEGLTDAEIEANRQMLKSKGYTDEQIEGIFKLGKTATDAATKVKTFTQLFDTLKEAAQSGWTQTWEYIVGDFEEAKSFFTGVSEMVGDFIGKSAESRNSLVKDTMMSNWNKLTEGINKAGIETAVFEEKLRTALTEGGQDVDALIEKHGSLANVFRSGAADADILRKVVSDLKNPIEAVGEKLFDLSGITETLEFGKRGDEVKQMQQALVDLGFSLDKFGVDGIFGDETTAALKEFQKANGLLADGIFGPETLAALEKAGTSVSELKGATEETVDSFDDLIDSITKKSGRELLLGTLTNSLEGVLNIVSAIKGALGSVFKVSSDQVYSVIESVNKASEAFKNLTSSNWDKMVDGINEAGIETSVFEERLTSVMKEAGYDVDALIDKYGSLANVFKSGEVSVSLITKAVKSLAKELELDLDSDAFGKIFSSLESLTEEDTIGKLTRTFQGLFSILKIITTFTGGAFRIAWAVISEVLGVLNMNILDLTASIGDSIVRFEEWIRSSLLIDKIVEKVANVVKNAIPIIKEFGIGAYEAIGKFANAIWNLPAVQKVVTGIADAFSRAYTAVSDFFQQIKSMDKITFEGVLGALSGFRTKINDVFSNFSFENIKNSLSSFCDELSGYFSGIGDIFQKLKDRLTSVFEWLKGIIPAVIGLIMAFTLIKGLSKIASALKLLASPLEVFESLSGAIKKFGNAKAFSEIAKGVKDIAIAVAILAGALAVLAYVAGDDSAKLWSALGALGALAGGLLVLAVALGFIGKFLPNMPQMAGALLTLSGSLLILVGCLKLMDDLDPTKALKNAGILAGLMVVLGVVAGLLGRFAPKLSTGSFTMVAMAASLWIMVKALEALDNANIDNVGKTLGLLVIMIGTISLIAKACSGTSFGSMAGIMAMAIGLHLLIGVMKRIAKLDVSEMKGKLDSFAIVFGALAALMLIGKLAGANALKGGVGIIAMAGALLLIIAAVRLLGGMDESELKNATNTIAKLLIIFGAVMVLSRFAGPNALKAGVMLMAMATAMLIMVGVIALLKNMEDPEGLDRAMGVITTLGIIMGALIALTSKIPKNAAGALITLTIAIAALAGVVAMLYYLSTQDKDGLIGAVACLTALVGVFSLLVLSTKAITGINWLKTAGTLLVLVGVVAVLGYMLSELSSLDPNQALGVAAALSLLVVALAGACAILSLTSPTVNGALIAAGVMVLIVGALGDILGHLSHLDPKQAIGVAAALSLLLVSLSGACAILSFVGTAAVPALAGIGVLAVLIAAVGGIMDVLGSLADEHSSNLDKGIEMLEKVGLGIGSFIGGIIGGIGQGITAGLEGMAEDLSNFMGALQPFLDGASSLDASVLDGVSTLVKMILLLTGANILDAIGEKITGGQTLTDFAAQLVPFGKSMKEFSNEVAGIDEGAVTAAANAGKMIAEMASTLPNSGGVVGWFMGENDMSQFVDQLVPFGQAMKAFSNEVSGIDEGAVEAAANAGKMLAEMASALPNSGGVLGWLAGENDMSSFKDQLVPFGEAMMAFSEEVTGIDTKAVETAANSGKMLAEMAAALPNDGGVISWFTGENDMSSFGEKLVTFGEAIKEFSAVSTEVDSDAIGNVVDFVKKLSGFGESITEFSTSLEGMDAYGVGKASEFGNMIANLASVFAVDTDINEENFSFFLNNLTPLGSAIQTFSNYMSGIDTSAELPEIVNQLGPFAASIRDFYTTLNGVDLSSSETIEQAIKGVGKALKALPNSGGAAGWFAGENDPSMFIGQLIPFAEEVKGFYNAFSGIDAEKSETIGSVIEGVGKALKKLPNSGGVAGWIAGENDPSQFVGQLIPFADEVKGFYNAFSGIDAEQSETIGSVIEGVSKALKALPNSGGVAGWIAGENDPSMFVGQLIPFANEVKGFYTTLGGIDDGAPESVSAIISGITASISSLTTIDDEQMSVITQGINNLMSAISNAVTESSFGDGGLASAFKLAATKAINAFVAATKGENKERVMKAIHDLFRPLNELIVKKGKGMVDACEFIMLLAIAALEKGADGGEEIGENLGQGLVDGLESMVDAAYEAGFAVGAAAAKGMAAGAGCASPSVLGFQSGRFLDMGLINGIDSLSNSIYSTGYDAGNLAATAMSDSIAGIYDMINSDIDAQPTIRPVLDLSDVSNGVNAMNSMFGLNPSVALMGNVGAISASMSNHQNGSNDDVISAIKDLGKKINSSSGDTYYIDGITYDDGSNITDAVQTLVRAAQIERRI